MRLAGPLLDALRGAWRAVAGPSLMRRLLAAQMLTLGLLWTLALALLAYSTGRGEGVLGLNSVYETAISAAESLADRPREQGELLQRLDAALREGYGDDDADAAALAPSMMVQQGGQVVYLTGLDPRPLLQGPPDGRIVQHEDAAGRSWRLRTLHSARSDTSVTLIMPDTWELIITLTEHGLYPTPLVISLPFLILPAWLSLRLALRPFRRIGDELAARGPQDLSPLGYQPQHAELKPLVEGLNSLMGRMRESAERERCLIADAAHELRTPLAALRVNVEALRQQVQDPGQRALMDSLLRSNERAARLVGQLLQLMRSDAAGAQPQEALALDELLQDRLAALEGLAAARGVELELETQPLLGPLRAEPGSLVSMVDNLIDNAIKYSPQGGTVRVSLQPREDGALLTVQDQGPGIPAALRERVFDRFFRAPDQSQSGSGLGLAIVRSVVERLHGRIRLDESQPGPGLRVRIWLPLESPAALPPLPPSC
nr:ATP-binding protein [Shinella sp. XGS7]